MRTVEAWICVVLAVGIPVSGHGCASDQEEQRDAAPVSEATAPALSAPADTPAPPSSSRDETLERGFPFESHTGKIFVQVKVNGKGPYWFAVDTGSPTTVIDTKLARELGLKVLQAGRIGGAGEGSVAASTVAAVELQFGDQTITEELMLAIDLNQTVSRLTARPLLGLIGNDWVSSRVVEVDFARQRLRVYESDGWKYEGRGTVVPASLQGYTIVMGAVRLAGEEPIPARFMIDTGAATVASLNTHFVNKHNLLERAAPRLKATVGYGLGGEIRHDVARVEGMRLGGVQIDRPVLTLSQDRGGALTDWRFDGIVGAELLMRYTTVIFDGVRHRMILESDANMSAPIEFDMSGLTLAGNGGEGPLVVYRVIDGSPAAEAGVLEGDEIMTIDGRELWGSDRDTARQMLKGDGEVRLLTVRRGPRVLDVKVKLRRMVMGCDSDPVGSWPVCSECRRHVKPKAPAT